MSKAQLLKAIEAVNRRYANGQNEDDQVKRMFEIESKTKGWTVWPNWDTYEMITDKEKLALLIDKYGYWSDEVRDFNNKLILKGNYDYMSNLNLRVKSELKEQGKFKKLEA